MRNDDRSGSNPLATLSTINSPLSTTNCPFKAKTFLNLNKNSTDILRSLFFALLT
ncbi:MAG: hypothetical protein LBE12_04085 [Planctomycetaceae bacterium]|nr:hypothetical protein [Planctomycetaceae bacterium]